MRRPQPTIFLWLFICLRVISQIFYSERSISTLSALVNLPYTSPQLPSAGSSLWGGHNQPLFCDFLSAFVWFLRFSTQRDLHISTLIALVNLPDTSPQLAVACALSTTNLNFFWSAFIWILRLRCIIFTLIALDSVQVKTKPGTSAPSLLTNLWFIHHGLSSCAFSYCDAYSHLLHLTVFNQTWH